MIISCLLGPACNYNDQTINFKGQITYNFHLLFSFAGIILCRYKGYDLSLNLSAPLKSNQKYVINTG